ncbi:metallophosphoesterase [Subdoligranulum sp. AF14-43]|nr:metallophosphoesterase [Subdoligranulum sp. AF14-43]
MKKRLSTKLGLFLYTIIVLLLILTIWTVWSNTALMVSSITILSNHVPAAFSGFRIAQVSDLHNAEFGENNSKLLNLLSENEPDVIAITGDLVDARHTNIEVALDFVKRATQIAPVYFVTGNHEASLLQYDDLSAGLEMAGAVVLEDEAIQLERGDSKIIIIGLADPDFAIKGDLFGEVPAMVSTKLNQLVNTEKGYTILLSHRPELFETYVSSGAELVFSGHAHGGQFRLPIIGGLIAPNQGLFPQYDAGVYSDGNTNMVISRGIGNSIIPFRFNNRPEVVLVELMTE